MFKNYENSVSKVHDCVPKMNVIEVARSKWGAVKVGMSTVLMSTAVAIPSFAAETPSGGISINFDVTEMFKFANIIISSLMPVVYITAGLGIGFLIINSLKNAFR